MSKNGDDKRTFGVDRTNGNTNVQEGQPKPMLEPGILKAFAAGLIVGNLNKAMMMGFLVGSLGGIFIQQNVSGVPNVTKAWRDLMQRWKSSGK